MLCLQALNYNHFNSHQSSLVLHIKLIILKLHRSNYNVQFLWVPSFIGILGNKVADNLIKFTSNLICPALIQLYLIDFIQILWRHITNH